jgi:hypothetical protein
MPSFDITLQYVTADIQILSVLVPYLYPHTQRISSRFAFPIVGEFNVILNEAKRRESFCTGNRAQFVDGIEDGCKNLLKSQ